MTVHLPLWYPVGLWVGTDVSEDRVAPIFG